MINTYQTSLAPPPVPPRLNRSHPVLIPGPLPSWGHSKSHIRLLFGVVLLHLFLSVGGFIYLYHNGKMEKHSAEAKAAYLASENQPTSSRVLARMVVKQRMHTAEEKPTSGYLEWDIKHSFRRDVSYYHNIWLTILQPGDYYVYSRVTFSKGDSHHPVASKIKLRKNETEKEKTVMQAYCNLESRNGNKSIPLLCTVSQGELIRVESGNQLSVWVQDLTLVDYEDGSTTFGMYKL